jgi:hypothetical protein
MFHSLMMFLAPEAAQAQATPTSPPAVARPVRQRPARGIIMLQLVASVVGNAAGFAVLLASCWMTLQLMEIFL